MASPILPNRPLTIEEFLEFEEASPDRHEFVSGHVYAIRGASAMTGASRRHHIIGGNVFVHLASASKGGPCRAFYEGFKLQASRNMVYYPDVMVLCDDTDADARLARRPCLVVEITSPDSARIDRGEKLEIYLRIPSLKEYLIIDQAARRVELHRRNASGEWQYTNLVGEGTISLTCPQTTLTLDEIYEGLAPLTVKEMEAIGYAVTSA